jgi:hypothetical protein
MRAAIFKRVNLAAFGAHNRLTSKRDAERFALLEVFG